MPVGAVSGSSWASLSAQAVSADPVARSGSRIVLTERGRAEHARVDTRRARTADEQRLLRRLTAVDEPGRASPLLRRLTGDDSLRTPDFVAVRSGAGVTSEFSGGEQVWSLTIDSTQMLFFGAGSPPEAAKGVAITHGADTPPADREVYTRMAMSMLTQHLDDAPTSGGRWNRPLIDATA